MADDRERERERERSGYKGARKSKRESEKKEEAGEKRLSLYREGERLREGELTRGRETPWTETASLHCTHETKSEAERRIARNNYHVHVRARKQGGEEKEIGRKGEKISSTSP